MFSYLNNSLHAEGVSLNDLASRYGTPCFVYSRQAITQRFQEYSQALQHTDHLICYAVKANSNIALLQMLASLGSGFDIVSIGELERVLRAGGDPNKVIFSGVGKRRDEIARALEAGIGCFNVESEAELDTLADTAKQLGKTAKISLRVNPDVDAQTHPYISTGLKENKFGIDIARARDVYLRANSLSFLNIVGIDCHIGSQLTEVSPFVDALDRLLSLIDELATDGIHIRHLDIGGGLGVTYQNEAPPSIHEYISAMIERIGGRTLTVMLEPGRSIVANAGILLTEVLYLKRTNEKSFAIVDAAMNDNIRPALYQAWQNIVCVEQKTQSPSEKWDIVGPVCETGDFLGHDRELSLTQGSLLAMMSCGAYGFTMSSNYNSRPRAAEILVDGEQSIVIRERESINSLMSGEHLLPDNAVVKGIIEAE